MSKNAYKCLEMYRNVYKCERLLNLPTNGKFPFHSYFHITWCPLCWADRRCHNQISWKPSVHGTPEDFLDLVVLFSSQEYFMLLTICQVPQPTCIMAVGETDYLTIFPASWWFLEISADLDSRKRTCLETPQKSTPNMSMVIQNKRTGQNGFSFSIDCLLVQWNHLCIFSKNLANPPVERLVSVERLVRSFWELPEKEIF